MAPNETSMKNEIANHLDYLAMLAQIDSLFDEYDRNKQQIDFLAPLIEQYETTSSYFAEFNQSVAGLTSSQALLQVLIDQHALAADDISELLGNSEAIAAVLNGQQTLTSQHLMTLSKRFGILPGTILQD